MRDASIAVIREIGVETGGSNIQFGVNPETGRMVVIEMNPRVSRSSALASKATGFPIAKIAAKLAVGYTLDEIPNDITRKTPASFEPTLDYVVVKIPKWQFEKFPGADESLGPQMKSVGEVMAIGRTFKEALLKGVRSLDTGKKVGSEKIEPDSHAAPGDAASRTAAAMCATRCRQGYTVKQLAKVTSIDPWFLYQLKEINDMQLELEKHPMESIPPRCLRDAKRMGFSDARLAQHLATRRQGRAGKSPAPAQEAQRAAGLQARGHLRGRIRKLTHRTSTQPTRKKTRPRPPTKKKVIILGSGPNRIGQGIEFDYCCCHASFALREDGFETIMINCNPETVSTDYDTSDRLYFEPLTLEDVFAVYEHEASSRRSSRRDRAIWRTDSAESRSATESRGRAHHRHLARIHRPRRRPQALRKAARRAGNSAGSRCDGDFAGRSRRRRQAKSAIPSWSGRRMSSAAARWSSPTMKTQSSAT